MLLLCACVALCGDPGRKCLEYIESQGSRDPGNHDSSKESGTGNQACIKPITGSQKVSCDSSLKGPYQSARVLTFREIIASFTRTRSRRRISSQVKSIQVRHERKVRSVEFSTTSLLPRRESAPTRDGFNCNLSSLGTTLL